MLNGYFENQIAILHYALKVIARTKSGSRDLRHIYLSNFRHVGGMTLDVAFIGFAHHPGQS